jgi:hypothetical protein
MMDAERAGLDTCSRRLASRPLIYTEATARPLRRVRRTPGPPALLRCTSLRAAAQRNHFTMPQGRERIR